MNEQVIEVEYDNNLVEEYKNNYIMEEEGIGAEMGEVYGQQTNVNEDHIEDLIDSNDATIDSFEEITSENTVEGGE